MSILYWYKDSGNSNYHTTEASIATNPSSLAKPIKRADPVPGGSHLSGVLGKGLTEASLYPRKYAGRWRRTQDLVLSG
jgi:hypothetical protein